MLALFVDVSFFFWRVVGGGGGGGGVRDWFSKLDDGKVRVQRSVQRMFLLQVLETC